MDIPSYLLGKKSSKGKEYTAGKNIEITEENVINNTIPFDIIKENIFIGKAYNSYMTGNRSVNIGLETQPAYSGYDNVLIGYGAKGIFSGSYDTGNSVIIGSQANSQYKQTIAIGSKAKTTKENQAMFGSESVPINEMVIHTSNGTKKIATEDYVDDNAGGDLPIVLYDMANGDSCSNRTILAEIFKNVEGNTSKLTNTLIIVYNSSPSGATNNSNIYGVYHCTSTMSSGSTNTFSFQKTSLVEYREDDPFYIGSNRITIDRDTTINVRAGANLLVTSITIHTQSGNTSMCFIPTNTTFSTPFNPTQPSHPTTKKYVDDAIASAITSTLGGNY